MKQFLAGAAVAGLALPMVALAASGIIPDTGGMAPSGDTSIIELLTGLLKWALMILGILGVLGFVLAGLLYLTAAGEQTRIDTAKRAMMYAIVGIIVGLAGTIIMTAIQNWLGGGSTF
jgi:hypothetical protein